MAHRDAHLTVHGRPLSVERVLSGRPAAHVAAELGVSRATGYEWLIRYSAGGPAGLRTAEGAAHPWPPVLPRSRWRGRPTEPLAYTRVHPTWSSNWSSTPPSTTLAGANPPPSSASAPISGLPTSSRPAPRTRERTLRQTHSRLWAEHSVLSTSSSPEC